MMQTIGLLLATTALVLLGSAQGQSEGTVHARCRYDGTLVVGAGIAVKGLLYFNEANNVTYCFYLVKSTSYKYVNTAGVKSVATICRDDIKKIDPSFTCSGTNVNRPLNPKLTSTFLSTLATDPSFFGGTLNGRRLMVDGRYWKSASRWRNSDTTITNGRIMPGPPYSASVVKAYNQPGAIPNQAPLTMRITGTTTALLEGNQAASYKNWFVCQTCAEVYSVFPTSVKPPTVPTTPPPTSVPPPVTDCPQAICDICVMPEN